MDIDDACQCWLCLCNYVRLRLSDKPSASTKGLQSSVAKVNGLLRIGVRLDDNQVPTPKAYNFLFLMTYSAKQRSTTASAHDPRSNDLDPRSPLHRRSFASTATSRRFFTDVFCIHGCLSTVIHCPFRHVRHWPPITLHNELAASVGTNRCRCTSVTRTRWYVFLTLSFVLAFFIGAFMAGGSLIFATLTPKCAFPGLGGHNVSRYFVIAVARLIPSSRIGGHFAAVSIAMADCSLTQHSTGTGLKGCKTLSGHNYMDGRP